MSLHIFRFRDGGHGGSHLLISGTGDDLPGDRFEKLANPETSGVSGSPAGRQNMVCSDAFIAVNDGRIGTQKQRPIVCQALQEPFRVRRLNFDVLAGNLVRDADHLFESSQTITSPRLRQAAPATAAVGHQVRKALDFIKMA